MSDYTQGLRVFLLATLNIMSGGEKVSYEWVEKNLAAGIATKLFERFPDLYKRCKVAENFLEDIDGYYREYVGCAEGNEGKYCCENDNGLQLVIALALNKI